jgi:hypothetical protein
MLTLMQALLGVASGALVGTTLGVIGGGGSILAVPLILCKDAHKHLKRLYRLANKLIT